MRPDTGAITTSTVTPGERRLRWRNEELDGHDPTPMASIVPQRESPAAIEGAAPTSTSLPGERHGKR